MVTRSGIAAAVIITGLACGTTSSNGPCTLTAIGAPCTLDTDCCTGYCWLYEDMITACQQKPGEPQACVDAQGYCTQNRNCCSGLCQNNACFAGADTNSCLSLGSTCIQDDSCCSDNCLNDGMGHTECAPQPQPEGGLTCGLPGSACTMPGSADPTECCFGACGIQSLCIGNGGGGGGTCGGAGAYCQYGTDCCSGQCQTLSGGASSCE
jgi:hypothetical protein